MAQQEHNHPNKQSPNDYQSIFNEDAEDTKEDYQSFLAGLDNNSPQAGGDTPQNKNNHTKHNKNNNNTNNSGGNNDNNDNNDNNKNQYNKNQYNNNNNNNNNGKDWNKASGNYKWQWDAGNQWKDYKDKDTKTIESQYGSTDTTYIEAYGVLYQIDFVNLKQTNTENGRFRKIRRVAINHTDNSKQSNHSSSSKSSKGGGGRGRDRGSSHNKGGNKGGGYSHHNNNNNKTGNYSGGGYNNGNMYKNDNNGSRKGRDNNGNSNNNGKSYGGQSHKNGNNNKNDNYPSSNNNNGNNSNNGGSNGGKSYNNASMYQRNDNYPSANNNNNNNNNHSYGNNDSSTNGPSGVWQVMLGQAFTNYDSGTSKFIESKFKQNNVKMFECNIRGNKYYINLNDMTQMNPKTGRSRKIKRVGGMSFNNNNNQNSNNNNNRNSYNNNGNNKNGNGRDNRGQMYYPHPPNMRQDDEKKNSGGGGGRGSGGNNNSNQNSHDSMHQGSPNNTNNNNNNNQNTHPSHNNNSYNQPMPYYHRNSNNSNNNNNNQNGNDNNNNNNNIAKSPSHKWQWKDDSGIFIDYDCTSSSQMEVLYQNRAKVYKYKRRSQVYTINFNQLKQYNDKTNASRDIRRVPMSTKSNNGNNHNSGPTMKWQFYDGCFIDYDRKISITMEKAYNNQQNTFSFNNEKTKSKYVINFTSMKQKNMKSKNERDIRRVPLSVKGGTAPPPKTRQRTNQGWPDPNTWKGPKATAKRKVFGKRIMTLYHITDAKAGDLIFKDHKMIRGGKGMFGGGIYFAETIPAAKHKAEHHGVLITAKVFVGKEHVVKDSTAGHFTFQDMQKMGCDSVYAPYGSGKGAAERVVYNFDQVCVIKKTDKY